MIKLNFKTTSIIINELKKYIDFSIIKVSTNYKISHSRECKSDLITIDANNHIGFEVFENEIIVFYFTNHTHFDDNSLELQNGEQNYVERAKELLINLFKYKIRHIKFYKGKTFYYEKYLIIYNDGREECIGKTCFSHLKLINPFLHKSIHSTTWQFDKSKNMFSTRQPKNIDHNAIEVIDINEYCYIEIFRKNNVYTYEITALEFDDCHGMYYWSSTIDVLPSGLYYTKEDAIKYAMIALKYKENS